MKKNVRFLVLLLCMSLCMSYLAACKSENVKCLGGKSFEMPLDNTGTMIRFSSVKISCREADIDDIDDYSYNSVNDYYSFFRYIYTYELSGSVEKQYANKKIEVVFNHETPYELEHVSLSFTADENGKFEVEEEIHTALERKNITPRYVVFEDD